MIHKYDRGDNLQRYDIGDIIHVVRIELIGYMDIIHMGRGMIKYTALMWFPSSRKGIVIVIM